MNPAVVDYSTLKSSLKKGISFAAYSLPGETKFTIIAQKAQAKEIYLVKNPGSGFIIHPFDPKSTHPILFIKDEFLLKEGEESKEFIGFIHSKNDYSTQSNSEVTEHSKENYLAIFKIFKEALDREKYKKLVLSRVKNSRVNDTFEIVRLFEKINHYYPNSFNHLSFTLQSGIWLGASPEILLSMDAEKARTVALAGTQRRISTNLSDHIWKSKEIEEQKFVIDFVQEILSNHIPKSAIEINHETVEAGKMVHRQTNFCFPSKHLKDMPEFLKELHPTPAVCGLPKEKAKQFIIDNERHDRAYYSGFLGPLNIDNQSHLFVNLRCLNMNKNIISLFVGGGLTKDSMAEKEWKETELKATTLQSLL